MPIVKILADQNIPCVAAAFHDLGEVKLMPGREIRREHLQDCQCLIIRTVTRVDANLLSSTPVEFVGTATIGADHIDLGFLKDSNISYSNAAGCNAEAASEYVISGLFALSKRKGFDPFALKAGIVGLGNVGSRLQHKLITLGIECLVCDPPRQETAGSNQTFVDLDTIIEECNFISLHLPLTRSGQHPTYHLLNSERLRSLNDACVLVNAARGEVVDNPALLKLLDQRDDLHVFLDTWEGEPLISRELLQRVDLATPHIAGYSVEGRLRGTQMVLDAACDHFSLATGWHMSKQLPESRVLDPGPLDSSLQFWQALFQQHCNIWRDHEALVGGAVIDEKTIGAHFDNLRHVYPDRVEYENCTVRQKGSYQPVAVLKRMGFQVNP